MIIDFHSHVLPGMDDGSESVAQSLQMLRLLAQQGVTHVVATPHFYAHQDTPDAFLARRAESEASLRAAMAGCDGLPELLMGAEVHYFPGISEAAAVRGLTIGGKSCMLLEMPEYAWTASMYREMEQLKSKQGITPILAHVDRYMGPWHNRDLPKRLARLPVAVQVNGAFFLRRSTRGLALKLLRQGFVHLLGSDCHNVTTRRPNLGEAAALIRRHLGEETLQRVYADSCELLR